MEKVYVCLLIILASKGIDHRQRTCDESDEARGTRHEEHEADETVKIRLQGGNNNNTC